MPNEVRQKGRSSALAKITIQRVSGEYVRYDFKLFHIDRMQPSGEIQVRTTKAGTHLYTWVPEWLQERIRARAREVGSYILASTETTDMNVVTDIWRRKLKILWTLRTVE